MTLGARDGYRWWEKSGHSYTYNPNPRIGQVSQASQVEVFGLIDKQGLPNLIA